MRWSDTGFLISKFRYNENSLISEFFTKNHGKVSGIVFGGTSKKIKGYLQIGNQLYLNYNSKSENKLGYFKLEIQKVYSPIYFENPQITETNAIQEELEHFANCIKTKQSPIISLKDGAYALEIAHQIIQRIS